MQEVYDFLKKTGTYYLATVEEDLLEPEIYLKINYTDKPVQ